MKKEEKGLRFVGKAHCYRTLIVDMEPGQCATCGNMCRYCYDQAFARVRSIHENRGELKRVTLDAIHEQLHSKTKIAQYLNDYRVIRIGALGDIRNEPEIVREYRLLMQLLNAHGYSYVMVTKSAHAINEHMLDDIAMHGGVLHVSMGYYSTKECDKFERVERLPPKQRRNLITRAMSMGIPTVLRLNPMHPDFMEEHLDVLRWFSSAGGTRVILETIRIMEDWKENMPDVDFNTFVRYSEADDGGFYRNYLTPPKTTHTNMTLAMKHAAHTMGIEKVTICGDMELNDRYGYQSDSIDCCQVSDILGTTRTPRYWESGETMDEKEEGEGNEL